MGATCGCLKCETGWKGYAITLARVLLALVFLIAGWSKLTGFEGTVGYIASAGLPMPEVLAVLTIIVELGGAILLIIGFHARIAAFALAVFTLLATLVYHMNIADPLQQTMFLKNLAIIGGLLYLKVYGPGPWSLSYKACPGTMCPDCSSSSCACCKDCNCGTCKA
jgi:putative oxidoreductase